MLEGLGRTQRGGWAVIVVIALCAIAPLQVAARAPVTVAASVTPATAPANDAFANAIGITSLPFMTSVDITDATLQASEPTECSGSDHTVWYRYQPSSNAKIGLDTIGTTNGGHVVVWTGSAINALTFVACHDYVHDNNADAIFSATAGTTYYIQAGGLGSSTGTLDLRMVKIKKPKNDLPSKATSIPSLPYTSAPEDIRGASTTGEPLPLCAYPGQTVWFKYTASTNHVVRADVLQSDFNGFVAVYVGSKDKRVACGDSGNIAWDAKPGKTYFIQVGGDYSQYYGTVKLRVQADTPPADDAFANSATVSSLPYDVTSDSTLAATQEKGEPDPTCSPNADASVWFTYQPSATQTVRWDTTGSTYSAIVEVYSGSTLGTLTPVVCGAAVVAKLTAGTRYHIQVVGAQGATGDLNMHASAGTPPANDDSGHATTIASLPFTDDLDTDYATNKAGEPSAPCTALPAGTVWYKYTPAGNTTVRVRTFGAGTTFDTIVNVYSGPIASPTVVACDDDSTVAGQDYNHSSVAFSASSGTTYWFQIGGYGTHTGALHVDVESGSSPANDAFASPQTLHVGDSGSVDTSFATAQANEPDGSCGDNNVSKAHSVWYKLHTASTTTVTFDATSSDYGDVTMNVFTGSSINSLTAITCSSGKVSWNAVGGTTFMIQVFGSYGGSGTMDYDFVSP